MNFSTARSAIAEKNGGQLFSRDRKLARKGRLMRFFICILLALCAVSQANGESLKQDDFFGEIVFKDGRTVEYTWLRTSGYGMEKIPYSKELKFHKYAGSLEKFDLTQVSRIDFLDEWCGWDLPGGKEVPDYTRVNNWVYKANVTFRDGEVWKDIYIYGCAWMWRSSKAEGDLVKAKSITINLRVLGAVSQINGESLKQDDFFGEIVFTDDFSDESSLWEVGYWLDGSAWYQDGWLHVKNLTSYSGSTYVLYSESFADCIIEVETKLVAGTDVNWQGVACRWVDEDNYYDFSISADGYYELAVWVNDKRMDCTVGPTWSSHIRQGRDVINVMRAECIGNTLRLSANGHLLAEITDSTFASGKIALSVNSLAGTYSEIAFDNLVITEPSPTRTPESTQLGTRKMVITDTQGIVAQISDYWIGRGGGIGNPEEYSGLALERGEATGEYDMCFRSVTRPCLVLPWDTIGEVEIIGRYLPSGREFDVWARITLTNGEVLEREELAFAYIHGMTREGGQYSIDQASIQKISFECCTENQNVKGILCDAAAPTKTMVITDAQGGVIQVNKYTLGTPYGDGVWAKCSGLTIWWGEGQMKFLWDTLREISVTRVETVRRGQNVYVTIVLMNGSVLEEVKLLDKKIVGKTLEGASYTTSWADVVRVSFRE